MPSASAPQFVFVRSLLRKPRCSAAQVEERTPLCRRVVRPPEQPCPLPPCPSLSLSHWDHERRHKRQCLIWINAAARASSSKSSSFSPSRRVRPRPRRRARVASVSALPLQTRISRWTSNKIIQHRRCSLGRSLPRLFESCRTSTFVQLCCINEVCKESRRYCAACQTNRGCAKSPSTFSD